MNTSLLLKNNPPVKSKTMINQERDIESQNNIITRTNINSHLLQPLRSILKKSSTNDVDADTLIAVKHFKITLLIN